MWELVGIAGFIAQCLMVIKSNSIETHQLALIELEETIRSHNEFDSRISNLEIKVNKIIDIENERIRNSSNY